MSQINLTFAARGRLISGENTTISGAYLAVNDNDELADGIDDAYNNAETDPSKAVELELAGIVSAGEARALFSEDTMETADYFAQSTSPATQWPDPMDRELAFPLAVALHDFDSGTYPSITDALTFIFSNFGFP